MTNDCNSNLKSCDSGETQKGLAPEHFKKMQSARFAVCGNGSTLTRAKEKQFQGLHWVYRNRFSCPSILEEVVGSTRSGLASKLVERGLMAETRTPSGGALLGVPSKVLTLTELGVEEVERLLDERSLLPYKVDPYRINFQTLRHDLLIQAATATSLRQGRIIEYLSEHQLSAFSKAGVKQPDSVWMFPGPEKGIVTSCAVEFELTSKWSRDLDEFVLKVLRALGLLGGGVPTYPMFAILSDSQAIICKYREAFKPGATFHLWKKNERRVWVQTSAHKIPPEVNGRITFQLLSPNLGKKSKGGRA